MNSVTLHDAWELAGWDGYGQPIDATVLPAVMEHLTWTPATVPGSVYLDLIRAGRLADVYADEHSLAAQWVERQFWFYRLRFDAPAIASAPHAVLVLEAVDLSAAFFLNGQLLGTHANFHRPATLDVTGKLAAHGNELIVRVDSGLLGFADRPAVDYQTEITAVETGRPFLRKPQFGCRWDWAPRLMNVGLGGPVRLVGFDGLRVEQVSGTVRLADDLTDAEVRVRAFLYNADAAPRPLNLRVRLGDAGEESVQSLVPPGRHAVDATIALTHPRLWWPRWMGEPHLYDLHVEVHDGSRLIDRRCMPVGIRGVSLRQELHPVEGRYFHLVVNGEPVFCKGSNWVPADLLYPRVTPGDYAALVDLAAECNHNLLRVWGGGLYEHDALYDACDTRGILVWQDMMFACARYPADQPTFESEVRREVAYHVRRLAHHPSLAIWCGNNEVDLGVTDQWILCRHDDPQPDRRLFHETLGQVVAAEDETRPYWPTSPHSPDGSHPNNQLIGDQHPWYDVGLGRFKGDYWAYRDDQSRFPNEGGILGPSTLKTIRQILPEGQRSTMSRTWLHHDNTQNTSGGQSMVAHMLEVQLGDAASRLSFDDFVRYGGILHGEGLETAIDNWRRRKFDSAAAIFWMFNDTWPAVTSWTPIDYYRRRKPAFWYVKRAFAPLRAICVEREDAVDIFVVNDYFEPRTVSLRYGLFRLAGGLPLDETRTLTVAANRAVPAARIPLAEWDRVGVAACGAFAVLSDDAGVQSTQRLLRARFKDLDWRVPRVALERRGDHLRLRCDTFAWAVCLDSDGETRLPDNYLDLLPGIPVHLPWPADRPVPDAVAANLVHL